MKTTWDRYQEIHLDRCRDLLGHFLASLPPGGWRGTIPDLEDALIRLRRRKRLLCQIPLASGLTKMVEFLIGGFPAWRVERWRTSKERGLQFTRTRGKR